MYNTINGILFSHKNEVLILQLLDYLLGGRSDQIRSFAQSCLTLCDPMNRSTPGLPVHH